MIEIGPNLTSILRGIGGFLEGIVLFAVIVLGVWGLFGGD